MQTSFVHNWRWSFVVLVVAAFIVTGFSCNGDRERQTAASGDDASVAASVPTTWTTYRSENLGVSIPYPEGWYVEENEDGSTVFLYTGRPPEESDMPERVSVTIDQRELAAVRDSLPAIVSETNVTRRGREVIVITHFRDRDPASDEEQRTAFVWTSGERTVEVDGVEGDSILDRVVDEMISGGAQ